MSLSLVSNSYLDDTASKIRAKSVPWEGFQRAGLITSEELSLLKRVDRQPKARAESVLLSDGQTYARLYLNLLKKLVRIDLLQCLLVLIGDALADHDERISLFVRTSEDDPDLPYTPLLRVIENQDDFLQLKASQIITVLFSSEADKLQTKYIRPYINALSMLIQSSSSYKQDIAVQCIEALLPRPECRKEVWDNSSIISGLCDIMASKSGPQMTYQVGLCFWLLTFDVEVAQSINKKYDIIPLLLDGAQEAVKEKVIRVIVATFRNLVTKAPVQNLLAMLVAQVLPFAKSLCARKWSDEDVVEDVQFLRDELKANFDSLTTYDEYCSELTSGRLSWTPVHESESFWQENAAKLNDGEYAQIKILVKLLQESKDPVVLAVVAHDIGQYVKHYDRGKKVITDLGAKTRVMELMTHSDANVRYQALLSVQNLVSHPWKST